MTDRYGKWGIALSTALIILVFFVVLFFVFRENREETTVTNFEFSGHNAPKVYLRFHDINEAGNASISLEQRTRYPIQYAEYQGERATICLSLLRIAGIQKYDHEVIRSELFEEIQASDVSPIWSYIPISGHCETFGGARVNFSSASGRGGSSRGSTFGDTVGIILEDVPIQSIRSSYYFPFDQKRMEVAILAHETISRTSGVQDVPFIAPHLQVQVTAQDWDEKVSATLDNQTSFRGNPISTHVVIDLKRPISVQILTPLLLLIAAIFIISLLKVDERGSFLEIAIGILLGLWGIQEIVLPESITSITFINNFVLALYLLLAIVSLLRLVVIPAWKH